MDFMRVGYVANRPLVLASAILLALWLATTAAFAQASARAEPVTGPDVTTIGGIATDASVNLRSGPAPIFPAVGTLSYGTRVNKGLCIGGGSARWCYVETMDGRASGYVAARFLVEGGAQPPGDDLDGGPDYWVVRGLAQGDRLNVRLEPRATAPALATLREGEIVRNLGCRMASAARWCRIRSTAGMDVTGWVAGRYLRESAAPPAVRPPGPGSDGHGPDFFVVSGVAAGDFLNVRSKALAKGTIIARLAPGAKVKNLGCERVGKTRWCRIRTIGGVEVTGWVNGRFLREG
jgi:uncharacterized protein YraI